MCGITGAVWSDPGKAIDEATLRRMTDALAHRGPDGAGYYRAELEPRPARPPRPGAALGHRRLAVIDPAGSPQPIANEDERLWLILGGEIYNALALRRRLEGAGHRFRTQGDAEVVVHLYEDEGPGLFDHLMGMFAFALWDARSGTLLLARDRLGKKPLVYRHEPGRLLFASELKSLLELPDFPRRVDPRALDEYLTYQYVPHPRTILDGFAKLPPGHYAVWTDGQLDVRPYWRPDVQEESPRAADDYIEALREELSAAVERRLHSDVPLGAFLSGGIDSTIVVALARKLAGRRLPVYSIGFAQREYDETRFARLAAERLDVAWRHLELDAAAADVLPSLVDHYDEPMADSSAVPTWRLAELARRDVTVVLSGDGGDELFAGYPRYGAVWLAAAFDRLPWPLRRLMAGRFWQRLPASPRQRCLRRRFKRLVAELPRAPASRYLEWIAIFGEAQRAELYSDEFLASLPETDPVLFLVEALGRAARRDPVTAFSLADLVTYLPCDLMTKVDIATMAHGLECRQPFLDHRVVELAARMPVALKFRRGRGKWILRRAFADLVPPEILRRRKMGFGAPIDHWFRGALGRRAEELLLDPAARCRPFFLRETIRRLLDEHRSGRVDHAKRLWALVVFESWCRRWLP